MASDDRRLKVDAASLHRLSGGDWQTGQFGEQVGERVEIDPGGTWFHVQASEDTYAQLVLWADGEPVAAFPARAYPRGSVVTSSEFPITLSLSTG